MDLRSNEVYLKRVDSTIEQLRGRCLGQDVPLMAVLPSHLLTESEESRADHLTRQLLFALAAVSEEDGEYQRSEIWLRGAILYLLWECNREDHTFRSLVQIVKLPQGVRALLFHRDGAPKNDDYAALREDAEMPEPLEELELAILCLLETHGFKERMREIYDDVAESLQYISDN